MGLVDIHALQFGNPIIFILTSICGFIGVMCASKLVSTISIGSRIMTFLGINSSLIMVTHEYFKIKTVISIVAENFIPIDSTVYLITEIAILVLIEICICKFASKYINIVITKLSGRLQNLLYSKA